MRVLGIDASLRSTGLAVIEQVGGSVRLLEMDTVKISASAPHSQCLAELWTRLTALIARQQPEAAAIEGGFFFKNAKIAMILGEVRGAAIAACATANIPIWEYPPRRVKQALTGWGAAPKDQVARMVVSVLGLESAPQEDAADAISLALCHLNSRSPLLAEKPL